MLGTLLANAISAIVKSSFFDHKSCLIAKWLPENQVIMRPRPSADAAASAPTLGMYAGTPENFVGKRDGWRFRLLQLSDMVFRARFAGLQLPFSLKGHVCRKTTV